MKRLLWITVICTVLQIVSNLLSLWSGLDFLVEIGAMIAAAAGGLLPGLVTALLSSLSGLPFGDERCYVLTLDFVVVLVTVYLAQRGCLKSARTWFLPVLALAVAIGVGSVFINGFIGRSALGMAKSQAFVYTLTGWEPSGALNLFATSILLHVVDLVLSFFLLSLAARHGWITVTGGLMEDSWQSRHVRRWKLGVKFIFFLALSAMTAGSLLFILVTNVFYYRMEANYTLVAANYARAAAEYVDDDTLTAICYPGGDRSEEYRTLYRRLTYFAIRTDRRVRHVFIDQLRHDDHGNPYLQVLVEPGVGGKTYGTAVTGRNYHALMGREDMSSPVHGIRGPFWSDHGNALTVYRPLRNDDGRIAAFVGIELDMTEAHHILRRSEAKLLTAECILLGLFMGVIYTILSRVVIGPVEKLADNLRLFGETGKKDETGKNRITSGDELEDLYNAITSAQDQVLEDKKNMAAYTESISRMANEDILTGVGSHAAYTLKVNQLNRRIGEGTAEFAVVMADMNGLKKINDTYGHARGDLVLKTMAADLRQALPGGEIYRMGGDEFVIILEGEAYKNRHTLTERLAPFRHARDFTCPAPWKETALSAGVAVYYEGEDHSYRDVFNRADSRMYEEKQKFGGRR